MAELPSCAEEVPLELDAEQVAALERGLSGSDPRLLPYTAHCLHDEEMAADAAQLLRAWASDNNKRLQILEAEGMLPALVRALDFPDAAFYAADTIGRLAMHVSSAQAASESCPQAGRFMQEPEGGRGCVSSGMGSGDGLVH